MVDDEHHDSAYKRHQDAIEIDSIHTGLAHRGENPSADKGADDSKQNVPRMKLFAQERFTTLLARKPATNPTIIQESIPMP